MVMEEDTEENTREQSNLEYQVPAKVEVVKDPFRASEICQRLMEGEQVIALGCKAKNLGPKAPLSLVQIGTVDGKVYLFDVLDDYDLFTKGKLSDLLEAENVEKVMHLCGPAYGALYAQGKTSVKGIFDTHVADLLIEMMVHAHLDASKVSKVSQLAKKYEAPNVDTVADKPETRFLWNKRPLTFRVMHRAAVDVQALVPTVYSKLWGLLDEHKLWDDFKVLVDEEKFRAIRQVAAASRDTNTICQNFRQYSTDKICKDMETRLGSMENRSYKDLRVVEKRLLFQMPSADLMQKSTLVQDLHTKVCDHVLTTLERIMETQGLHRDTLEGLDASVRMGLRNLKYKPFPENLRERAAKVFQFIQHCKFLRIVNKVLNGDSLNTIPKDQQVTLFTHDFTGLTEECKEEGTQARKILAIRIQHCLLRTVKKKLSNVGLLHKHFQRLLLAIPYGFFDNYQVKKAKAALIELEKKGKLFRPKSSHIQANAANHKKQKSTLNIKKNIQPRAKLKS